MGGVSSYWNFPSRNFGRRPLFQRLHSIVCLASHVQKSAQPLGRGENPGKAHFQVGRNGDRACHVVRETRKSEDCAKPPASPLAVSLLALVQLSEAPLWVLQQLGEGPLLQDTAPLHHQNAVGVFDGGQPVGHGDSGPAGGDLV